MQGKEMQGAAVGVLGEGLALRHPKKFREPAIWISEGRACGYRGEGKCRGQQQERAWHAQGGAAHGQVGDRREVRGERTEVRGGVGAYLGGPSACTMR